MNCSPSQREVLGGASALVWFCVVLASLWLQGGGGARALIKRNVWDRVHIQSECTEKQDLLTQEPGAPEGSPNLGSGAQEAAPA